MKLYFFNHKLQTFLFMNRSYKIKIDYFGKYFYGEDYSIGLVCPTLELSTQGRLNLYCWNLHSPQLVQFFLHGACHPIQK
jgi:hypothetical protein